MEDYILHNQTMMVYNNLLFSLYSLETVFRAKFLILRLVLEVRFRVAV